MAKAVSRTRALFHKPYKAALELLMYFLYDLIVHQVVTWNNNSTQRITVF